MSQYGIQISTWFRVEGDCHISYEVCAGEVELALGGQDHDVQIVATEDGLQRLADTVGWALAELRAATPA
ncbi:hypothetical protein ACFQV2_01830 [Actinokineospora soli]|uniref:Uncharacterized protein n=1 Tax=Actinokineospora soli TaxID=1048753 RepID=A0ABW2TIA9_9PSEU